MYDATYRKRSEQASLQRQKVDSWLPRTGVEVEIGEVKAKGYRICFWSNKNILKLIMVMDTALRENTKNT